ncbi:MAG TPA: amidohydrolase family protein [Chthoniobacterales bacterium]|jgi:imidazolonepropionase-like amidohydrolase/ABC-type multidrug transport system permease subunit
MKAFLALLKIDLKLASRNRAVLFFNYLFPLIFFFVFAQMFSARQGSAILQVVTMVIVLGILGNGLFGAGMRAVQEREENVLRRYKVTPITPVPLLGASMLTGVIIYLPSVLLMLFLAHQFYGMAMPSNLVSLFVFVCLGAVAFRSLGLIIAAVVNSSQESNILIQPIYMTMLFLSGATIPITFMPHWVQNITQFVPATYLMTGIGGIIQRGETVFANWQAVVALLLTTAVATFIATKLFRWEKEEKLRASAKLWVLVVLLPFVFLGAYQAWSQHDLVKARILARDLRRGQTWLIQNARIFVGNGRVIESGAILVRQGKIAAIYEGAAPDPKQLDAEPIDAAGKTVLPGLIDVHVHLGATGGFYDDWSKYEMEKSYARELEAYLYCGVTAVRSAGDQVDPMLKLRQQFNGGEKLGSELFLCGPLFTAEGGHGTEYAKQLPEMMRAQFNAQFLRIPKSQAEARKMVDDLANKGVDAIKGILESGAPPFTFNRMNLDLLRAVVDEAHARRLPASIHTGDARDVADAVSLGADSVEHGSFRDEIPDTTIAEMKRKGIAFDPTLSVAEGFSDFAKGDTELLKRSLVQQVTTKELLTGTEHAATSAEMKPMRDNIARFPMSLEQGDRNLQKMWRGGVMLVTGSDAGNFLVMHGPTVQREIELWVAAGIPTDVALEAATANAAKLLRADNRIGTIEKGKDATLLIVDGNPLQDVHALSAISVVMLKGERVARPSLFEEN